MRRTLRSVALIVALPLVYFLASIAGALIPGPGQDLSGRHTQTIGLIQGPIHTDILLPLTPGIRARFAFAEASGVPLNDPRAAWLLVGWGATGFYTTAGTYADITASAVLTAAIGDTSVLRLDALGPLPDMPELTFLPLSGAQYQSLLTTLDATFARDASGLPRPLDHPGFTDTDAFFHANGGFHLFRTCNVWLGKTLRAAGIPFGIWTPTTQSVNLSLWWHHGDQTG
ncbi:TIGR02117 family protein [Tabrizicola sp.]|uniref:TIGR02117 family protein n=1 Tax=Tabrizicola sp. TaxID=2005166 RepID=UPI00286AEA0F|nr:TIGR02117 family protein [Tabrizicola sp.]